MSSTIFCILSLIFYVHSAPAVLKENEGNTLVGIATSWYGDWNTMYDYDCQKVYSIVLQYQDVFTYANWIKNVTNKKTGKCFTIR